MATPKIRIMMHCCVKIRGKIKMKPLFLCTLHAFMDQDISNDVADRACVHHQGLSQGSVKTQPLVILATEVGKQKEQRVFCVKTYGLY